MNRRSLATIPILLTAFGMIAPAATAADPTAQPRLDRARKTYDELILGIYDALVAPGPGRPLGDPNRKDFLNPDLALRLRLWSSRWRDAEFDLAQDEPAHISALEKHFQRMKALEEGHVEFVVVLPEGADETKRVLETLNGTLLGFHGMSELDLKTLEESRGDGVRGFLDELAFARLEAESALAKAKTPKAP